MRTLGPDVRQRVVKVGERVHFILAPEHHRRQQDADDAHQEAAHSACKNRQQLIFVCGWSCKVTAY